MSVRQRISQILLATGFVGMLAGALDPMEGSLLVLPGSALVAIGAWLDPNDRRAFHFSLVVFVLVAIGVGSLWGLSAKGGIGGPERSMWWGSPILLYLVGWALGISGPAAPRWVLWAGLVLGLWFVALLGIVVSRAGNLHMPALVSLVPGLAVGATGALALVGCISRLRAPRTTQAQPPTNPKAT